MVVAARHRPSQCWQLRSLDGTVSRLVPQFCRHKSAGAEARALVVAAWGAALPMPAAGRAEPQQVRTAPEREWQRAPTGRWDRVLPREPDPVLRNRPGLEPNKPLLHVNAREVIAQHRLSDPSQFPLADPR